MASAPAPAPDAATTASSSGQACVSAQSLSGGASIEAIAKAVHPTADQSAKLGALKTAEESAEKTLAASCATQTPATAEGRLDVVDARLQAMTQASDAVRGPLNDFYSSLSDEQKAAFNALGQDRNASTPKGRKPPSARRRSWRNCAGRRTPFPSSRPIRSTRRSSLTPSSSRASPP